MVAPAPKRSDPTGGMKRQKEFKKKLDVKTSNDPVFHLAQSLIDVLIKELPKYPGLYHKVVPQLSVKRQTKTGLCKTSKRNSLIPPIPIFNGKTRVPFLPSFFDDELKDPFFPKSFSPKSEPLFLSSSAEPISKRALYRRYQYNVKVK